MTKQSIYIYICVYISIYQATVGFKTSVLP